MKKEENSHHKFESLSEAHRAFGLPKPVHPLISLINGATTQAELNTPPPIPMCLVSIKYPISQNSAGSLKYGQDYYDFDEGGLMFASPNQINRQQ